jgi:hypothetical protein
VAGAVGPCILNKCILGSSSAEESTRVQIAARPPAAAEVPPPTNEKTATPAGIAVLIERRLLGVSYQSSGSTFTIEAP